MRGFAGDWGCDVKYIATISGGKDSVTMCDLLLKNNYPVDYIIFNDTLDEFDDMYEYLEKIKTYFLDRYGKKIITTIPIRNFKDSVLRKVYRSKTESRNGQYVGLPVASGEAMCHLRKTLKMNPFDKWVRKNLKGIDYRVYVGFTIDESDRAKDDGVSIYPLIDYFNMSEVDCKKYIVSNEMENTLYRFFNRTGCSKCPYKTERDWYQIYHNFKKVWNEAIAIEDELSSQKEYKFFLGTKPLREWEMNFKQGSLFDFSDEPVKDCFCKI